MIQISKPFNMKHSPLIAQASFQTASKPTTAEDQLVRTSSTKIIILIPRISKKRIQMPQKSKTWREHKSSHKKAYNLLFNKHRSLKTSLLKNQKFISRKTIIK